MVEKAGIAHRDRAIDDQQILAFIVLHRRARALFGGLARSGLQRMVVVERDEIEDQIFQRRRMRARDGFGAAGAFLEREPDHRLPSRLADGLRHHAGHRRR